MELWNPLRSLISFLNSADESHQSICFKFPICDANLIIFFSVDVQQNYLIFMEYFEILTWFALFNKCLIFTGGKILFIVFVKKSIPIVGGVYQSTQLKQNNKETHSCGLIYTYIFENGYDFLKGCYNQQQISHLLVLLIEAITEGPPQKCKRTQKTD